MLWHHQAHVKPALNLLLLPLTDLYSDGGTGAWGVQRVHVFPQILPQIKKQDPFHQDFVSINIVHMHPSDFLTFHRTCL